MCCMNQKHAYLCAVGFTLQHQDMKNIKGISCTIDLLKTSTTEGGMVWNEAQTEQYQAPKHSTIKFRVICKNRQLAEDVNTHLVNEAYAIARRHGCTMQHSGGMTNNWNSIKFGATFHGENSEACVADLFHF